MRRFAPFAAAALALAASASADAALTTGAKAADFTTRGAMAGKVVDVHLAALLRKGPVVLYFFPAAFTGGCNAEAHAFAEAIPAFTKAGATVIGMSADDVPTLQRFSSEKCARAVTLAPGGPAVVAAYDVDLHHQMAGRNLTTRTSYVIDRDGRVAFVHNEMDASRHVETTLAAVQRLGK